MIFTYLSLLVFRSKNIALEKPELLNPPDPTLSLIFLTSVEICFWKEFEGSDNSPRIAFLGYSYL
jgi:hypothetical protein